MKILELNNTIAKIKKEGSFKSSNLIQESANYSPQAKPSPLSLFVNGSTGTLHAHLIAYCLSQLCATMAELGICNKKCVASKM